MSTDQIHFTDGAGYERYMGKWSQFVASRFLEWLAPKPRLRWLDVGCGNGAFTEMLTERCEPSSVSGIDPSEEQLAFARTRPALHSARFRQADAMNLPFPDAAFDVAIMPLVIFFVPDPAKGVAEMARVVSPGGTVTAYAWDMLGGGFPYESLHAELRNMGVPIPVPPSNDVSRCDSLRALWSSEGLEAVETTEITAHREFADFEDYWSTVLMGPSVGAQIAKLPHEKRDILKARMRQALSADGTGQITCHARANAVKGRVPVSF